MLWEILLIKTGLSTKGNVAIIRCHLNDERRRDGENREYNKRVVNGSEQGEQI